MPDHTLCGIYIKLREDPRVPDTNEAPRFIHLSNLSPWKHFVGKYYVQDVEYIEIVAFSKPNGKLIGKKYCGKDLINFEICYSLIGLIGSSQSNCIAIYTSSSKIMIDDNYYFYEKTLPLSKRKSLFQLKENYDDNE